MITTKSSRRQIAFTICAILATSLAGLFWIIFLQAPPLEDYPRPAIDHNISGIVITKNVNKSVARIILDNGAKFTISGTINYEYSTPEAYEFVKLGDYITKRASSDTLTISRGGINYFFILNKVIGMRSPAFSNMPQPRFEVNLEDIANEFRKKYRADFVRIGRPWEKSSEGKFSYWLSVEVLNPETADKDFKAFGEQVARDTYAKLLNDGDFEKIEVSAIWKKGFIIKLRSRKNTFVFRDSL